MDRRSDLAWAVSAGAGLLLWGLSSLSGGGREPWDLPSFWTIAYPAALALCGVLGFFFPVRPWRWPLIVFAMLGVVMAAGGLMRGSDLGMLPPGLVLLAVLALPGVAVAAVGAAFGRRRR
jgi:hypothetical protein